MFYSDILLAKHGLLANVWLAANLDKKLTRSQFLTTDIQQSVDAIIGEDSSDSLALRLSSQLLFGVAKIYHRQTNYLLDDSKDVLARIEASFRTEPKGMTSLLMASNPRTANLNLSDPITNLDFMVPDLPSEFLTSSDNPASSLSDVMTETQVTSSRLQADYNDSIEFDRAENSEEQQQNADLSDMESDREPPLDIGLSLQGDSGEGNSLLEALGGGDVDIGGHISDIEVDRRAEPYSNNDYQDFDMDGPIIYGYDDDNDDAYPGQKESSFLVAEPDGNEADDGGVADLSHVTINADDLNNSRIATELAENERPRKARKTVAIDSRAELTYQELRDLQSNHDQVIRVRDRASLNIYEDTLRRFQATPVSQISSFFYKSDIMLHVLGFELTPELVRASNRSSTEPHEAGSADTPDGIDEMHADDSNIADPPNDDSEQQGPDLHSFNYSGYDDIDGGHLGAPDFVGGPDQSDYTEPVEVIDSTQQSTRIVAKMINTAIESSGDGQVRFTSLQSETRHEKAQNFFEVLVLASRDSISVSQQESFGEITISRKQNLETIIA